MWQRLCRCAHQFNASIFRPKNETKQLRRGENHSSAEHANEYIQFRGNAIQFDGHACKISRQMQYILGPMCNLQDDLGECLFFTLHGNANANERVNECCRKTTKGSGKREKEKKLNEKIQLRYVLIMLMTSQWTITSTFTFHSLSLSRPLVWQWMCRWFKCPCFFSRATTTNEKKTLC